MLVLKENCSFEFYHATIIDLLKASGWTNEHIESFKEEIEDTILFCYNNNATVLDCIWTITY